MEEKKTSRFHINMLDVVLVLLALLCVVGVWQRNNIRSLFASGEELDSYTVSFEIRKMRSATVELLPKGTALYTEQGDDRIALGTISDHLSVSAAVEYLQIDGTDALVKSFYPEDEYETLLDASGKLICRGIERDGRFLVDGELYLAVNQTIYAMSENADLEIRIVAISKNP